MLDSSALATGAAPAAGSPTRSWSREFRETATLAVPLALTQLAQIAMLTTDVVLLGRLGAEAVAAAALGMNLFWGAFMFAMGIAMATGPLTAQAVGRKDPRALRRATRMGLWVCILVGVPFSVLLAFGEPILLFLGQKPDLARMAGQYLDTLAWCMVPALWLIVLRNFIAALKHPRSAMWIMLVGIVMNGLLVWVFVFGKLGMPAMGIAGAGLATTLVQVAMVAAQLFVVVYGRRFRRYHVLGRWWRADWRALRELFVVGLPIALALILEAGVFVAAVFLVGLLGTVPLAAHQIVIQVASVTFMVPFGIAQAATVRVGHAVGRRDAQGVRRAGLAALALGVVFMAAMGLLVYAFRQDLPLLFLDPSQKDGPAVIAMAAALLLWAALFQIFDGAQAIAMGSLRGMTDTRVPMLLAAMSYWGVGFGLAYGLGVGAGLGAPGVWMGLAAGLLCAATLLSARFNRLSLRRPLPPLA